MYGSEFAVRLLVLVACILVACKATDEEKPPKSPVHATLPEQTSDEEQLQYRAVCIEKEAHGGNEYMLSRWLESRDKANELGQYHGDFKYKGHRWRIEERAKYATRRKSMIDSAAASVPK